MYILIVSYILLICSSAYATHDLNNGDRVLSVQLFNWKWSDVSRECTTFLGPNEFGAVQISPPQEHIVTNSAGSRPWWIHYQPVSYKMNSRMGSEQEFKDMVTACNTAGVHVIVDAVLNHMVGSGNTGVGSAGSSFDGTSALMFPGVPFGPGDFHGCNGGSDECTSETCGIEDFNDEHQEHFCRLSGLLDLATEHSYVRGRLVEFLNRLISWGVKGFRIDAIAHMPTNDVAALVAGLNNVPGTSDKPFIVQETTGSDEYHYGATGRVTDFRYADFLNHQIEHSAVDLLTQLTNNVVSAGNSYAFTVNHDKERDPRVSGSDHCAYRASYHCQDGGARWRNSMAEAFLITYPHGLPRVMSGYHFDHHDEGPPENSDMSLKDATDADGNCLTNNGWDCRHRSTDIYPLAALRARAAASPLLLSGQVGNYMQIAYSLGSEAFVAINAASSSTFPDQSNQDFSGVVRVGLAPGTYCNVVYAQAVGSFCAVLTGATPNAGRPVEFVVTNRREIVLSSMGTDSSRVIALHAGDRKLDGRVSVFFKVSHAYTNPGERIVVVGNHADLGDWDCRRGVDLSTGSSWGDYQYPTWAGVIYVAPLTQFEWKAIKTNADCSSVIWSTASNTGFFSGVSGEIGTSRGF